MLDRRQFLLSLPIVAAGLLAAIPTDLSADITHTVQPGDNLSNIARRYGTSAENLRAANNLRDDVIQPGQVLQIPSAVAGHPIIYTVRRGDTLERIARDHGTTVARIRDDNQISGDRILPGQQLTIWSNAAAPSHGYIAGVIRTTNSLRVDRSQWRYIVGHHSGINSGNAEIYDRFHRRNRRMANGLAYHFVIGNGSDSGNGEIEIGGRWIQQIQGGHVRDALVNQTGIGICLVGNFEERRPTAQQMAAFTELVHYLKNDLLGGNCRFTVHREIDGSRTLCPGRNFPTRQMHRLFS